jgi:hypothetical protein
VVQTSPLQNQSPSLALARAGSGRSTTDELQELAGLHRSGGLTDAELAIAKARVLGTSHEPTLQDEAHRRPVDSQAADSLFIGAYVIDAQTQARGQVVQVLDDGSGLVRLEDGTLVKTALSSPPSG